MSFIDYRNDLNSATYEPDRILDKYFHCGQTAAFHGAGPEAEPKFKREVAVVLKNELKMEIHPMQLVVCGSAHLGFSPVPNREKFGRPFNPLESDIDVAVVSLELFDRWWRELQDCNLQGSDLRVISEEIFCGLINPSNVRNSCNLGRKWWELFGKLQTDRANGVRGRVYRDHWTMQKYHRRAIEEGRKFVQGNRA